MITLQLQRAVTTNLTLAQQVAKEHLGLDALPGYILVVFERREQGGAVFSRLVSSGESFGSRFRIFREKYFAIAVNDSVLSYAFDHPIVLEDGSEEFTLKFHLTYRVADPRKVAEILQHDPLRQLREEVVRVIGRNCAKRKAEMFRNRFKDLERIVIDSESVRLRPYAAELGFRIVSIDLDKPLPDYRRQSPAGRPRPVVLSEPGAVATGFRQKTSRTSILTRESRNEDVDHQDDLYHKAHVQPRELEGQVVLSDKMDEERQPQQTGKLQSVPTDPASQAINHIDSNIATPAELREDDVDVATEIAAEISVATQPDCSVLPEAQEEAPEINQPADSDAQTNEIDNNTSTTNASTSTTDDSASTTWDSRFVAAAAEPSLLSQTWKNETSRLLKLMAEAGADADTATGVREELEAIAVRYFPARN